MTRQEMLDFISQAKDIPVQIRVTARLFVTGMTDAQVAALEQRAMGALQFVEQNDRAGFEKSLAGLGLGQFAPVLSRIAFHADNPNPSD